MGQQSSHPLYQQQNSFKRAPVMGNRGLETRNSKRANQRKDVVNNLVNAPNSQPVVGALEVQNVKRAIHRYGTLPKGARIGAYLESLRQNADGTPVLVPTGQSPPVQSNLVDPPAPVNCGLSPRTGIKTQPQMIRSNSSGGVTMTNSATASLNKLQRHRTTTDGTMMTTFSSFRGASSPKRNALQPLADLEFPPPPLDLPPPPEEFEVNNQYVLDIPPPKMMQTKDADVSNTEPSVEEASSRFGVSLRKREPSTDSCSSLGSPATNDPILNVCPPPPPPVAPPSAAVAANAIKEKLGKPKDVPKPVQNHVDPAALLVNELAEHMNLVKPETAAKPASKIPRKEDKENGIPFKAQLKKVEPKRMAKEPQKEECNNIIDFKSRLRKVDASGEVAEEEKEKKPETKPNNMKKTEIKIEIAAVATPVAESEKKETLMSEEDKRKSTGSISSLKKLWEAKDKGQPNVNNNNEQITQLSPKLCVKNGGKLKEPENNDDNHFNNNNCVSTTNQNHANNNHVDDHPKKPAVPVKPTKFTIYATPTIQQHQKLIETNGTPPATNSNQNSGNSNSNPILSSRENILELVQLMEYNLKNPVNSAAQWLQLSDKLNHIQSSCVTYADSAEMPPHTKFQFRELVTRVENQSNCLRSAGSKNVQDNEKLLVEVGQSLKQLSNALHR